MIDQIQHISTECDGFWPSDADHCILWEVLTQVRAACAADCRQADYQPATYYNFADMLQEEIEKIV